MKKNFVFAVCPGDVPEEPPIVKGDEVKENEE